jgi:glycosyltransferase involved in cell wall biosynthesis
VPRRRALIYAPSPLGGIAEHVHYQARELARRGFAVTMLCRPDYLKGPGKAAYRQERKLIAVRGKGLPTRLGRVLADIVNRYILAAAVVARRPEFVLLEANSEYHATAWFLPHWLLRRFGAIYVANFHDPVRAPGWRPGWLHRLTLRLAHAPLAGGLVHGPVPREARLPERLIVREAQFGPFDELAEAPVAFDLRARLAIPREAFVVLAFGHIADRKNLDLLIAAIAETPNAHLMIAGQAASSRERPISFYHDEVRRLGVGERVQLVDGFIPESDVPAYFVAADAVALTYARSFVSQSGVLQIAALFDRPLLASGGDGPLRETVERFGLGVTVEPDSTEAIAAGLRRLIAEPREVSAGFAAYRATTSWEANVDRLLEVVNAAKDRNER